MRNEIFSWTGTRLCVWTMWYAVCKVPRARLQKQRSIPHKILHGRLRKLTNWILYVVIIMHRCAHSIFIIILWNMASSKILLRSSLSTTTILQIYILILLRYYFRSSKYSVLVFSLAYRNRFTIYNYLEITVILLSSNDVLLH